MTPTDQPSTDSSGNQYISNEARAYTLLIETLEKHNTTTTTTDRWVIATLSIITCITAINMYLVWDLDVEISKANRKNEAVTQTVNQTVEHPRNRDDNIRDRLNKLNKVD